MLATIFGEKLEDVIVGAAHGAMDYIAYVDETWVPKEIGEKADMLAMEAEHLESLEVILRMAQMNECSVLKEIEGIMAEEEARFQLLEQREIIQ